ncbi:MAG: corrinoid protein-associated methyltransferase CpaM [Chloroflexota bacterium]
MATVFMKWLETSPKDYDRGIQLLTLGRLQGVKEEIVRDYVQEGSRVLEIGCGTGALTRMMAEGGGIVTAIDSSPKMLSEAQRRIKADNLEGRVTLEHMDASLIGERFPARSFDLIVFALVLSELSNDEQGYILEACTRLLAPEGHLLLVDEVIPSNWLARLIFYLVRLPLVILTWLLTRTSTSALQDVDGLLTGAGFHARRVAAYLGGSLVFYEAHLPVEGREMVIPSEGAGEGLHTCCPPSAVRSVRGVPPTPVELAPGVIGRLCHRVTLRTLLIDLWALFFRILPPYPKVRPGLYAIGRPTPVSPVLVTGNFDLTVRRLVRAIDKKVDAWVLVADSAGINVWCGAGGGYFTAEKVIAALMSSGLGEVVDHHTLILPQLCANGVSGQRVREETGWNVRWGPVRAADIPAYLAANGKKTEDMRLVHFPLKDRLEMATVVLGFYGLLILIPVLIFWRHMFWPVCASLVGLSYFYSIFHLHLPGRDGLMKSLPLSLIALAGLFTYSALWHPLPTPRLFSWSIGLIGLSVFTGGEMQGMSPLMRGEQANWGWEVVIGAALGLLYWLIPIVLGWR